MMMVYFSCSLVMWYSICSWNPAGKPFEYLLKEAQRGSVQCDIPELALQATQCSFPSWCSSLHFSEEIQRQPVPEAVLYKPKQFSVRPAEISTLTKLAPACSRGKRALSACSGRGLASLVCKPNIPRETWQLQRGAGGVWPAGKCVKIRHTVKKRGPPRGRG